MSFDPQTGLVYIPAQNVPVNLTGDKDGRRIPTIPANPIPDWAGTLAISPMWSRRKVSHSAA